MLNKEEKLIMKAIKSLRERFEEFFDKPFEEISETDIPDGNEASWGSDVGDEIIEESLKE